MTLPTLTDAKRYLRVDGDDDDATIATLLAAASAELARYIGAELPDPVPADLQLAVLEQVAWHYDNRGTMDARPGLCPAAARIAARFRGVSLGAPESAQEGDDG